MNISLFTFILTKSDATYYWKFFQIPPTFPFLQSCKTNRPTDLHDNPSSRVFFCFAILLVYCTIVLSFIHHPFYLAARITCYESLPLHDLHIMSTLIPIFRIKMETACFSETMVYYRITIRYYNY